jgi:UDP-N-acetylmuramate dehydrogenase
LTNHTSFAELTTLRVGGAISDLRVPANRAELISTFVEACDTGEPWFLLGSGSNIVVSDEPFTGVVILVTTKGIEAREVDGRTFVTAQAGETWDDLVEWTVKKGLSGLEAMSGIPGTVGAAPIQNIGAYGAELSEVFESLQFVDAGSNEVVTLTAVDLAFGYRSSSLKRGRQGLVVSVTLALKKSPKSAPIRYEQLASKLGVNSNVSAETRLVRETVLELRRAKGMVLSVDPDSVSVGSFFVNPIVESSIAASLPIDAPKHPVEAEQASVTVPLGTEPKFPNYESRSGKVKLSAAWLIENAGIPKGFSIAGSAAAISGKHTLAIINRGGATASQVLELARLVAIRVHDAFGIQLQIEPTLVGFE